MLFGLQVMAILAIDPDLDTIDLRECAKRILKVEVGVA